MMKTAMTATAAVGSLLIGNAHAEVRDCIAITAIPAIITQQGVHCLKQDLSAPLTSGAAITIAAHNVTIEMNGFKLGGLGGGADTQATGILATDRTNITVRNGTVRGFLNAILFGSNSFGASNSGHLVEDMRIEGAKAAGVVVRGTRSVIRNNVLFDIGNGPSTAAVGIDIQFGEGHSITGNSLTRITETGPARGIFVANSAAPYIRGNQIRDVSGDTRGGIYLSSAPGGIIQDNFISNSEQGTRGVNGSGSNYACIGNVVTNFATPFSGCTVDVGNTIF